MKEVATKHSSHTDWRSPSDFVSLVKDEFGEFDLDVCATKEDTQAPKWIEKDSLSQEWRGLCWMNPPPYDSRGITPWVRKAYEEGKKGNFIVCLLPALPDQKWFHDYVMKATEVRFIRGRLSFSTPSCAKWTAATFASMLVIFAGDENTKFGTMARRKSECR